MSLVRSGVMTLPPGFRFHPTDEELVAQYLRRKVMSYPVPASIISEVEVCKADPWDLPGVQGGEEMYFFSTREAKYPNGNRSNRATVSGFWKATGKDKAIVVGIIPRPAENKKEEDEEVARIETVVVGMKKTLVFYRGKPPHGCRTDWIMHEYRLANYPQPPSPPASAADDNDNNNNNNNAGHEKRGGGMIIMKDWVLCRIFLKKRNSSRNNEDEGEEQVEQQRNNNSNSNIRNNNGDDGGRDLDDDNKKVVVGRKTRNSKKRNRGDPVYYDFLQTKKKKKKETRRDGGGGSKGGCGEDGRRKRGEWLSTDLNLSPCLSSSGSSGVTAEVCFNNEESADEKEESSSCNSFASFTKKI